MFQKVYNNDRSKKSFVLAETLCSLALSIICIYQLVFLKHPVFVRLILIIYYGVKMYDLS